MILIEALESIIEIDGSSQRRVESKSDPTWRISRVIRMIFIRDTGIVVSQVDFLCIDRSLE